MTVMYNVLEALGSGAELSSKDRVVHAMGLVTTLLELHDKLDAAVADAYGWVSSLYQQEILERLMMLNSVRVQQEQAGLRRYLRPEYQDPKGAQQGGLEIALKTPDVVVDEPRVFPERLAEQTQLVRQVLLGAGKPLSTPEIAQHFRAVRNDRLEELVKMFVELGQAWQLPGATPRYAA